MDIHDLVKKFIEHVEARAEDEDETKWLKVGLLKAEDITRRRKYTADTSALRGRARVLVAKLEAIEAERDVIHMEFWEFLYSNYNLPRDRKYTITDDNHIRMKPKNDGEKGILVCVCGNCK